MADIRQYSETREIVSVLDDQLALVDTNLLRTVDTEMTKFKDEVVAGKRMVIGQLVMVKSFEATTLGSMPAIVNAIKKDNTNKTVYYFTLLTGNLANTASELTTISTPVEHLETIVDLTIDVTPVVTAITNGKLGYTDLRDLKLNLNIPHVFVLDVANQKLVSHY